MRETGFAATPAASLNVVGTSARVDDTPCFHGGAFFAAIGEEFDHLERRRGIVNADVLDAWFPPAPAVIAALRRELPWLARTSPPTQCEGLVRAIARARELPIGAIVPGAGSSDLIFRCLPRWLARRSRALVLDPSYGEYAHVLEQVVRCRVDRFELSERDGFAVDLDALLARVRELAPDLLVLVNPNNPAGRHVPRSDLADFVRLVPERVRIWVDEAYVDYVGAGESLEPLAARQRNLVVCKSLSKVLALSGMRVGYVVAEPAVAAELRRLTPPWVVSLPAQVAAVAALRERDFYARRHAATHALRDGLVVELEALPLRRVLPSVANWILCLLPRAGPTAAELVAACRERGVFLRDAGATSRVLGSRAVRVAVRSRVENARIVAACSDALRRV